MKSVALYLSSSTLCLALLAGCGTDVNKQVQDLDVEIVGVHDEIMPLMCNIAVYKEEIKAVRAKADSLKADTLVLNNLEAELTKAEDDMNNWMSAYQRPKDGDDPEKALAYLKKEREKVAAMKTKFDTALGNAAKTLKPEPAKLENCKPKQHQH